MRTIRPATPADAASCLEIYRPIVEQTVISFETDVPALEAFARRIEATLETHPWLVCEVDGTVTGYAYAYGHRGRSAYQWCAEVSLYVDDAHRRGGLGRSLYGRLFDALRVQGFVNAYAGIALPNPASIAFHESMGFLPVGVYRRIGFKFNRWHDVGWWALRLRDDDAPSPPRPLSECRDVADAQVTGSAD